VRKPSWRERRKRGFIPSGFRNEKKAGSLNSVIRTGSKKIRSDRKTGFFHFGGTEKTEPKSRLGTPRVYAARKGANIKDRR